MHGKDVWSHVSTFRGRLNIPMVFNSRHHEDSAVDYMLEKIKNELLKGLGIAG